MHKKILVPVHLTIIHIEFVFSISSRNSPDDLFLVTPYVPRIVYEPEENESSSYACILNK